jgi:putative transcriptional regulator
MLRQMIEEMLEENGFNYCEYSGCFDIAARRDSMLLIKLLTNVDSFQEDQANNLKIMSNSLDAKSLLVGLHTRRETLENNVLYERFEIPTVTPKTLESFLASNTLPTLYRFRGGVFVEIDPSKLRAAREAEGFSQSELAGKVGITKKSVYEHEKKNIRIDYGNAVKLERVLKTDLMMPSHFWQTDGTDHHPKTYFETSISRTFRKMGFETSSVYQSPFNMIAKDSDLLLLSDVEERSRNIEKKIPHIKSFSKISGKSAVVITKDESNFEIPSLTEEQLSEMDPRAVRRIIKRW